MEPMRACIWSLKQHGNAASHLKPMPGCLTYAPNLLHFSGYSAASLQTQETLHGSRTMCIWLNVWQLLTRSCGCSGRRTIHFHTWKKPKHTKEPFYWPPTSVTGQPSTHHFAAAYGARGISGVA